MCFCNSETMSIAWHFRWATKTKLRKPWNMCSEVPLFARTASLRTWCVLWLFACATSHWSFFGLDLSLAIEPRLAAFPCYNVHCAIVLLVCSCDVAFTPARVFGACVALTGGFPQRRPHDLRDSGGGPVQPCRDAHRRRAQAGQLRAHQAACACGAHPLVSNSVACLNRKSCMCCGVAVSVQTCKWGAYIYTRACV